MNAKPTTPAGDDETPIIRKLPGRILNDGLIQDEGDARDDALTPSARPDGTPGEPETPAGGRR